MAYWQSFLGDPRTVHLWVRDELGLGLFMVKKLRPEFLKELKEMADTMADQFYEPGSVKHVACSVGAYTVMVDYYHKHVKEAR